MMLLKRKTTSLIALLVLTGCGTTSAPKATIYVDAPPIPDYLLDCMDVKLKAVKGRLNDQQKAKILSRYITAHSDCRSHLHSVARIERSRRRRHGKVITLTKYQ